METHKQSQAPPFAPKELAVAPVTAVIPAYEREDMVRDTVWSVQNQTLPVAEILVVDDGSTDRTAEVAESLGVRVIRQENQGVSAARNTGIQAAGQEWIALLDSDDLWEPDKIEEQWNALRLRPGVGLLFTDHLHFDASGVVTTDVLVERAAYRNLRRDRIAPDVVFCDRRALADGLFSGNFIKPSTMMARRDLCISAGLFDTGFGRPGSLIGQTEDRDFFLRLVALTDALVIERSLVRYRVHEGGASQNRLGMAMGAAHVAERVLAHPESYPPGAVEYFRRHRPRRLREAGILLMEEGRHAEARSILWRSLRERPGPRTLAAFGVSLLGPRLYDGLVRLKRRTGLPGLRNDAS